MISESGSLKDTSVYKVLFTVYEYNLTGILSIRWQDIQKILYFKNGKMIWAISNAPSDDLADVLSDLNMVAPKNIERVKQMVDTPDGLGKSLVEKGLITLEEFIETSRAQMKRIVYGILRWRDGDYQFLSEPPPEMMLSLDLNIMEFIRDFIFKKLELSVIRKAITSRKSGFTTNPDEQKLKKHDLSEAQLKLLQKFDGVSTPQSIIQSFPESNQEFLLKVTYYFLAAEIILDGKKPVEAEPQAQATAPSQPAAEFEEEEYVIESHQNIEEAGPTATAEQEVAAIPARLGEKGGVEFTAYSDDEEMPAAAMDTSPTGELDELGEEDNVKSLFEFDDGRAEAVSDTAMNSPAAAPVHVESTAFEPTPEIAAGTLEHAVESGRMDDFQDLDDAFGGGPGMADDSPPVAKVEAQEQEPVPTFQVESGRVEAAEAADEAGELESPILDLSGEAGQGQDEEFGGLIETGRADDLDQAMAINLDKAEATASPESFTAATPTPTEEPTQPERTPAAPAKTGDILADSTYSAEGPIFSKDKVLSYQISETPSAGTKRAPSRLVIKAFDDGSNDEEEIYYSRRNYPGQAGKNSSPAAPATVETAPPAVGTSASKDTAVEDNFKLPKTVPVAAAAPPSDEDDLDILLPQTKEAGGEMDLTLPGEKSSAASEGKASIPVQKTAAGDDEFDSLLLPVDEEGAAERGENELTEAIPGEPGASGRPGSATEAEDGLDTVPVTTRGVVPGPGKHEGRQPPHGDFSAVDRALGILNNSQGTAGGMSSAAGAAGGSSRLDKASENGIASDSETGSLDEEFKLPGESPSGISPSTPYGKGAKSYESVKPGKLPTKDAKPGKKEDKKVSKDIEKTRKSKEKKKGKGIDKDFDFSQPQKIGKPQTRKAKQTNPVLLIIFGIFVVAGGIFFYLNYMQEEKVDDDTIIPPEVIAQETPVPSPKPKNKQPLVKETVQTPEKTPAQGEQVAQGTQGTQDIQEPGKQGAQVQPVTAEVIYQRFGIESSEIKKKLEKPELRAFFSVTPKDQPALKFFKEGKFIEAGNSWKSDILKTGIKFTILLEMDCMKQSVINAFLETDIKEEFYLLNRKLGERSCFLVLWGRFYSQQEAADALNRVSAYFRKQENPPRVTSLDPYL